MEKVCQHLEALILVYSSRFDISRLAFSLGKLLCHEVDDGVERKPGRPLVLARPRRDLSDGAMLVAEHVAYILVPLPVLPEVDADRSQRVQMARWQALKHRVVVRICEDEALYSLKEVTLVVFEERGSAAPSV